MLILTRKLNEAIHIGENIRIKVLHISENQIKIGIEAPDSIRIFREEIVGEVQKQNATAAQAKKSAAMKAARLLTKEAKPNIDR